MNNSAAEKRAAAGTKMTRLLIPVDATERSRWGLQYALRLQRKGVLLQVFLLFVAEPVTRSEVLRFRTVFEQSSQAWSESVAMHERKAAGQDD